MICLTCNLTYLGAIYIERLIISEFVWLYFNFEHAVPVCGMFDWSVLIDRPLTSKTSTKISKTVAEVSKSFENSSVEIRIIFHEVSNFRQD